MTMKNRCSGRISTIHNAAIRFAVGVIVAIIASHAAQVPALAQTSDANSPPPSSNTQAQASAFSAGIGQAADSPAGYGQGASAYGQRFGASMANRANSNLIGTYFLSSALHDDPRYFVMGNGSFKESVKYALRRLVIVRKDEGGEAFNWPGTMAPLAAAGLANTYMPDAQRTAGYTFRNYGLALAASAGVNLLKEYWPTITRKVLVPMGISNDPGKP